MGCRGGGGFYSVAMKIWMADTRLARIRNGKL